MIDMLSKTPWSRFIEREMRERGIETEAEFARLVDVDASQINRWTTGTRPRPKSLRRVLYALGYNSIPDELAGSMVESTEEKPPPTYGRATREPSTTPISFSIADGAATVTLRDRERCVLVFTGDRLTVTLAPTTEGAEPIVLTPDQSASRIVGFRVASGADLPPLNPLENEPDSGSP